MLVDPEVSYLNKDIAEAVGISERQFYRWKEDSEFTELVNHLNEQLMDTFATDVYKALREKVKKGDVRAIELAMKRMGVLIDRKEIQSDVHVEVEAIAGKSNDQLLAEIADKEGKLLLVDMVETSPREYVVDTADDA
jgi:predicted nucleic acid-binding protein